MKKKREWVLPQMGNRKLNLSFNKMKLTLIFTMLVLLTFGNDFSQANVTFQFEKATIRQVLKTLEDQTGHVFLYKDDIFDPAERYSVDFTDESFEEVLNSVCETAGVDYEVKSNRQIILTEKGKETVTTITFQQQTVSGVVTDQGGLPLPGVSVVVKGTATGTVTNNEGEFSLDISGEADTLQFSFVGMRTQQVPIEERTTFTVVMEEDIVGIEEVVAIGYGTMRKSDLTGSVQRVDASDFKTQSMVQVTDMLAGTVAGFNANQGTSAQGGSSMQVRGPNSLTASSNPLIVLDGVIFEGALRDINPYDIESVDILKDASSAAVFGSKAASGVVIITTTKGRTGKPTINFSTKMGLTENYNKRRGLGPEEYIQFRQDYFRQIFPDIDYHFYTHPDNIPGDMNIDEWRNLSSSDPLDDNTKEWMARLRLFPIEQENYLAGKTTDWYDKVFRTGLRQEYDLSISGGTDVVKYYWSVGYNDNEGIRVGDQYSSVRSRLNADFQIVEWLKMPG